jgi:hypothetical protein
VLDAERVHALVHLVRDLRTNGHDRNLIEAVWNRLHDDLDLESPQLREGVLLEDGSADRLRAG